MNSKKSIALSLFCCIPMPSQAPSAVLEPMRSTETVAQACNLQNSTAPYADIDTRVMNAAVSSQKTPVNRKPLTILLYIQARNNLAPFAIQNLRALTNIGASQNVNFIIQWEQPGQRGVFRYALEGHQIIEKYRNLEENNITKPLERLINAFRWTVTNYPSDKVAVFYWNHGLGPIDPIWGNPLRLLTYAHHPRINQKFDIDGITHISNDHHRGLMFDEEAKVYLNLPELVKAGHAMKTILGRKLDVIGFDACFMSTVEIWHLLSDFAHIGVGSADIELATGWHYSGIMQQLQKPNTTGADIAKAVVSSYGQFYNGRTHLYTLSAINLDAVNEIKKNLDIVSHRLAGFMDIFGNRFKQVLIKARKATLEYANPMFADMRTFYVELYKQLSSTPLTKLNDSGNINPSLQQSPGLYSETRDTHEIKDLKHHLLEGIKMMENALISHTSSAHLSRGSGFGIYFPCRDFYDSYCSGIFSKVSLWPDFVKKFFKMTQDREYAQLF